VTIGEMIAQAVSAGRKYFDPALRAVQVGESAAAQPGRKRARTRACVKNKTSDNCLQSAPV